MDGLSALGFEDSKALGDRLVAFGSMLLEAGRTTSLVGARSMDELVAKHFLDSLAPLVGLELRSPVIDVGSGAGLPGIPAALAFPDERFVLLEPRKRRFEFLRAAIAGLGLRNVEAVQMTAETAARGDWRESAGAVLMRAIGPARVALELGVGLMARQGILALYRGRDERPAAADLRVARVLGAEFTESRPITVPYLDAERHLWVFRKVRATPAGYPRRSGIPGKEPLTGE